MQPEATPIGTATVAHTMVRNADILCWVCTRTGLFCSLALRDLRVGLAALQPKRCRSRPGIIQRGWPLDIRHQHAIGSDHRRQQRSASEMGGKIVAHEFAHGLARLDRPARLVRLKNDVWEAEEARIDVRFVPEHVERGSPIRFSSSAAMSAGSSTTVSRETLTNSPSGPSASNTAALTRLRVAAPPAVVATSTLAWASETGSAW
jgi:hypothetical protein